MAIPATVFWLMNLLSYVSIERVDASTFIVCGQVRQRLLSNDAGRSFSAFLFMGVSVCL